MQERNDEIFLSKSEYLDVEDGGRPTEQLSYSVRVVAGVEVHEQCIYYKWIVIFQVDLARFRLLRVVSNRVLRF